VQALGEAILKDYGTIDILVNAAGIFEYSGALEGKRCLLAVDCGIGGRCLCRQRCWAPKR